METTPEMHYLSTSCVIVLAVAVALVLMVATVSQFNAHPDEYLHYEAARYYTSHWLQPPVGDPSAERTYSHHGVSYLDEPDVVYLFAGKFVSLFSFTGLPPFLLARAFNFILFILLFVILLRAGAETRVPVYAFLLLSPQIWYVFSYFNSDAFAFFVGICLVLELFRFTRDPEGAGQAIKLGVWLGLVLLVKRNYYVLIPVVAAVAVWQAIFFLKAGRRRLWAKQWLKVALIASIVGLPRIAYQQWVNGFALGEARYAQVEKIAAPGYKPGQVDEVHTPWHVHMRARGHTAWEILSTYKWPIQSFRSMVGLYGYMNILSPSWYYWAMFFVYVLLFGRLCLPSRQLAFSDLTLTLLVMLPLVALAIASFLQSWIGDFQAQGRYLFPVFCVFLLLLAHRWERLRKRFFYLCFLCAGVLSLGNFSFLWGR